MANINLTALNMFHTAKSWTADSMANLDGGNGLVEGHFEVVGDGQGGHHVVCVVVAHKMGGNRHFPAVFLEFHPEERGIRRSGKNLDALLPDTVAAGAKALPV